MPFCDSWTFGKNGERVHIELKTRRYIERKRRLGYGQLARISRDPLSNKPLCCPCFGNTYGQSCKTNADTCGSAHSRYLVEISAEVNGFVADMRDHEFDGCTLFGTNTKRCRVADADFSPYFAHRVHDADTQRFENSVFSYPVEWLPPSILTSETNPSDARKVAVGFGRGVPTTTFVVCLYIKGKFTHCERIGVASE